MYKSIQTQLSEINSQINFIFNILTNLTNESVLQKNNIFTIETNLNDIISTVIDITNDSEMIHQIKGVKINEENNK
jgi:hypothetical protein